LVVARFPNQSANAPLETKKKVKREIMVKSQKKSGFALGAVFALVASLFSVTPASAVTEAAGGGANITIKPVAGTALGGLVTEDFRIYADLLPGITNANFATTSGSVNRVVWEFTSNGLYDIVVGVSSDNTELNLDTVPAGAPTTASTTVATYAGANSYASVVSGSGTTLVKNVAADSIAFTNQPNDKDSVSLSAVFDANGSAYAAIRALTSSTITSASPNAVVTVKIYIDELGGISGTHDSGEWFTTVTVTLHGSDNVPVTHASSGWQAGSKVFTASAEPSSALNVLNLNGYFYLYAESTGNPLNNSTGSASTSALVLADESRTNVAERSAITGSADLGSALANALTLSQAVYYSLDTTYTTASDMIIGTWAKYYSGVGGASAISLRVDNNAADVTGSATAKKIRQNGTYTILFGATTNSGNTSVSGVVGSIEMTGVTGLTIGVKEIKIGNGAWTTSLPTAEAVTTGANGWGSLTFTIRGFADTDTLTVKAASGGRSATNITMEAESNNYRVVNDYHRYQTAPGTAVTIGYSIRDQWNVLSTDTHQINVTRGGTGFNYATTVSTIAVSGGKASFAFTPESATATGSATIQADGYRSVGGVFLTTDMTDDSNITVNVSSVANSFTTGLAGSYSSSISYFPSTLSWVTVTAKAANTGSAVTVTGTGVVFKDAAGNTASGTMTVRVDASQNYTFYATSEKVGTYTMTLTTGATSTTSLLIVDQPGSDEGVTITWDTTAITAGTTKIVTGKLVDANGNAVYTDNVGKVDTDKTTASIVVTYTGTAGIVVGTLPTETDANGEFKVSVLTSALDSGTFTLTAVYSKDGSVTAVADKITSVQSITVGANAAAVADQKVNAGSFKGYVAIYAKGYRGHRLSAKVGNDWVVVESLASNFERIVEYTGAGYTIAVRIYIDRVLVDTITVTTK